MLHIQQRNSGHGPIQCRADNTEEGVLAPITVEESESINICDSSFNALQSSYGVRNISIGYPFPLPAVILIKVRLSSVIYTAKIILPLPIASGS